jgi:hypothetical protein
VILSVPTPVSRRVDFCMTGPRPLLLPGAGENAPDLYPVLTFRAIPVPPL